MDAWLSGRRDALARETGIAPNELDLNAQAIRTLLDLARIAAHESGQRINAPLVCYLIGRAQGSADLDTLAEIVRATQPV